MSDATEACESQRIGLTCQRTLDVYFHESRSQRPGFWQAIWSRTHALWNLMLLRPRKPWYEDSAENACSGNLRKSRSQWSTFVVGTCSCRIHALIKFDAIEAYRNYNIRLIQKCACGVNFRKTDLVLCVVTWSGRIHVDFFNIWKDSIKPSLRLSWFSVSFVSKGNIFLLLFYSTAAGVVPCGGHKTSPRTSS